jgi:hypothetical protein
VYTYHARKAGASWKRPASSKKEFPVRTRIRALLALALASLGVLATVASVLADGQVPPYPH